MENKGLISVIVPVYKVEKYMDRCVKSIVGQTYTNLEIILVDDGSPDICPKMCDEWAKMDSRIKVFHKENGGVSSARNKAIDVATGEYILFVDSDDYLELNYVEELINASGENIDLVCCGYKIINDKNKIIEFSTKKYRNKDILHKPEDFFELVLNWLFDVTVNKLFKRDLIGDIRFDTNLPLGEDRAFNLKYFNMITNNIVFIDSVGYNYVYNTGSAIHKNRENSYELLKIGVENLVTYANNRFDDYKCENYYLIIGAFVNAVLSITSKENMKSVINKLKADERVKDYLQNFKPNGFKEKLRFWLIKHNKYIWLKKLSQIKSKI